MAKQVINLGTAPTGVGGDTPRSAFSKSQANFDELYNNFVNMGLGNVPPVLASPALNAVDYFGYFYVNAATNAPPSPHTSGYLMVQPINTLYTAQTLTSTVDGSVWTRSKLNGTWSSWARGVNSTNILGAVSQTSGVPTGSVFERGSNANGEYIKYADGTLECWRLAAFSMSVNTASGGIFYSSSTITGLAFASSFIAKPTVMTSVVSVSGLAWLTQASEPTTTAGPYLFVLHPTSGTISGTLNQRAIGRWY